jgi:hypothetical protein
VEHRSEPDLAVQTIIVAALQNGFSTPVAAPGSTNYQDHTEIIGHSPKECERLVVEEQQPATREDEVDATQIILLLMICCRRHCSHGSYILMAPKKSGRAKCPVGRGSPLG